MADVMARFLDSGNSPWQAVGHTGAQFALYFNLRDKPDFQAEGNDMSNHVSRLAAALSCAAAIALMATTASAMPATHALALKNAAPSGVETVQWRRGWGWGLGGFAAGAIIGGALAAPYYYGPPRYYPYPYYPAYAPYPVYPAPYPAPYPPRVYYQAPAGDIGYCQQRYRSYDPRSGTYLGSDGLRHPCP